MFVLAHPLHSNQDGSQGALSDGMPLNRVAPEASPVTQLRVLQWQRFGNVVLAAVYVEQITDFCLLVQPGGLLPKRVSCSWKYMNSNHPARYLQMRGTTRAAVTFLPGIWQQSRRATLWAVPDPIFWLLVLELSLQ